MELSDLLTIKSVVPNLYATSKKQVLQELAKRASKILGMHERAIFDVVLERERLGTTGVCNGGAIPQGKLPDLDRLHGLFARLAKPIDFDSVDERPVDLVFLLLAPESAGADRLKALARISRLFRDKNDCEKLRRAESPEALYELLTSGTCAPGWATA